MGVVLDVSDFDLGLTLQSGQCFRYDQTADSFVLRSGGYQLELWQQGQKLYVDGAPQEFVCELFQLEKEPCPDELCADPVLKDVVVKYRGLRVMRLPVHETILGFICSSQSNIPRIRKTMELLAQHCGSYKNGCWQLPAPGTVIEHGSLEKIRAGYRAKYLRAANMMLDEDYLSSLANAPYENAHALLCTLPGVGPKVADCICLFGLGHGSAFPVDVHVLRAMRALFPKARIKNELHAKKFAQKRWGEHAGLAQQFIFQWARDNRGVLL